MHSVSPTSGVRILLADDGATDRLILETLLRRLGHEVLIAGNGEEAVSAFVREQPDLVLLDVMMPVMDGIAAARRIRELMGNDLVPIIFLTALHEARDLAACLEAGGDDFLSKPYNPVILEAKIRAFSRMRRLHSEVRQQREYLLGEQQAAKAIFERITTRGAFDGSALRYLMSPMAIFNGDVLLAAQQPGGDLLVLLGDFTGHGLPAAMGVMPLSEIFYAMVAKSFGLEAILREINRRLHAVLPTSIFCCATALQLHSRKQCMEIWAGGLPDGIIYNRQSGQLERIPSRHLPLGILAEEDFRYAPQIMSLTADQDVYLWSDGICETCNPQGEAFGEQRLLALFGETQTATDPFDLIVQRLREFSGSLAHPAPQQDDYSLARIRADACLRPAAKGEPAELALAPVGQWAMEYELRADSLKAMDPVPMLMHMLLQSPGLRSHGSIIHTIVRELYANALEHGVLELDSGLKQDADGFRRYYQQRAERLQALTEASIRLRLEVSPLDTGGLLRLYLKDSGAGFSYAALQAKQEKPGYHGRGLSLVAALCRRMEFFPPGNEVLVEFVWQTQEI